MQPPKTRLCYEPGWVCMPLTKLPVRLLCPARAALRCLAVWPTGAGDSTPSFPSTWLPTMPTAAMLQRVGFLGGFHRHQSKWFNLALSHAHGAGSAPRTHFCQHRARDVLADPQCDMRPSPRLYTYELPPGSKGAASAAEPCLPALHVANVGVV